MISITKLSFLEKTENGKEHKRDRDKDLPLGEQGEVTESQLSGRVGEMKP